MAISLNDKQNKKWLHPTGKPVLHVREKDKEENSFEQNHFHHDHEINLDLIKNELNPDTVSQLNNQQARLENAIQNIEGDVVAEIIHKVQKTKNAFEQQNDVMSESSKEEYINALTLIIAGYYKTMFPIFANQLMKQRAKQFGQESIFDMNKSINNYIQITARRASDSHINTIIDDILKTANESYENEVKRIIASETGSIKSDKEIFEFARKRALEGASRARIIADITTKYNDISKNRAKAIARTETNRAFTQSQFQADIQFLKDANLTDVAYKRWITQSDDPCPYCTELQSRGPIPFKEKFESLGSELHYDYTKKNGETVKRTLKINYEALEAGNAHVNCQCRYVLVIKTPNGFVENGFRFLKIENRGYNPYRAKDGKFTTGGGSSKKLKKGFSPKKFSGQDDAADYIEKQNYDDLTENEVNAIGDYAGSASSSIDYHRINDYMRYGTLPPIDNRSHTMREYTEKIRKNIVDSSNSIRNTIKNHSSQTDMVLYRTANLKNKLKVGDSFEDKGFVSTSIHPEGIPFFPKNGQVITMDAPKGTKGIFPEKIMGDRSVELEFLMNPSSFKVESITQGKITRDRYTGREIDVEFVKVSLNG